MIKIDLGDLGQRIFRLRAIALEKWIDDEMSVHLEPDDYLKAFGNDACKKECSKIISKEGYTLVNFAHNPNRTELWKNGQMVSAIEFPDFI